jgi:hypothetical protein
MTSRWLGAGLFLATLSTLLLETLDARLLSVLTWYHLSFLAVSLAMLGMAAGAVFVFLHEDAFSPERAPAAVARIAWWFACAIPLSHIVSLVIPFLPMTNVTVMEVLSVAASTLVLAVPFALSGVIVTAALTRCGGSIGRLYALDLLGAALGCVLVIPLLERSNISGAILVSGVAAALATWSSRSSTQGRIPGSKSSIPRTRRCGSRTGTSGSPVGTATRTSSCMAPASSRPFSGVPERAGTSFASSSRGW